MKKVLTLALALVLALSLAVPALAFWGTAPSTATAGGITVDIYLVDYDASGSLLAGLLSLPATDRGYAKNEVVAAIASVIVPANVVVGTGTDGQGYRQVRLSGSNVSINVTDNYLSGTAALVNSFPTGLNIAGTGTTLNPSDNRLELNVAAMGSTAALGKSSSAQTYRVLYYAKVTGDDAKMTITMTKTWSFSVASAAGLLGIPLGSDYIVTKITANEYLISEWDGSTIGDSLFLIGTTSSGKADSVHAFDSNGNLYAVTYNSGYSYAMTAGTGNIGRVPTAAQLLVLNSRMNDIFSTALGLDITKRAYSMTDDDWGSYANSLTNITESVDVEPWTPYVTVPSNVVTDPPKTGDAASILGFVMIALAGAAVVAVKKVRA